jgi:hypothetical protein
MGVTAAILLHVMECAATCAVSMVEVLLQFMALLDRLGLSLYVAQVSQASALQLADCRRVDEGCNTTAEARACCCAGCMGRSGD